MIDSVLTPTATASSPESPPSVNERAEMVHRLNETDALFAEQLANYSGRAARWSLVAGTIGAAASAYPILPHLKKTRQAADIFAQHVSQKIRHHVTDAQSNAPDFEALRPVFLKDVEEILSACGRRSDGVVHAIERLFHRHVEKIPSQLAQDQALRAVSDEAAHLLRNIYTRSPLGGVAAVVGSAVAAGVAGYELFKVTHPHQRQEVEKLARECHRLETLNRSAESTPFTQRIEDTRTMSSSITPTR